MAPRRSASTGKRERSIPIKVSIDTRPAPTSLPPLSPDVVRPPAPEPRRTKKAVVPNPIRTLKQPVHEWSEAKRRKIMWSLVAGGAVVIILGWGLIVRFEMTGSTNGFNLFSQTKKLLGSIHWPGTTTPKTKSEQEVQQFQQQVFPQFSQ